MDFSCVTNCYLHKERRVCIINNHAVILKELWFSILNESILNFFFPYFSLFTFFLLQVKCRRKNSLDCVVTKSQGFIPQPTTTEEVSVSSQLRRMDQLLSSDQGHTHQQGLYMRARWRRNSCAFARCSPVPPEPRAGDSGTGGEAGLSMGFHHHFPLCSCLGCANGLKGTELLDMDRRSNLSWSMMVGLSDCRSVDTGLNELSRITGTT